MKILIKDLVLYGYHGVREHEKKNGQEFMFNISLQIKDDRLAGKDVLSNTVSYSDVIREVKKINEGKRVDLLETLSKNIAESIFKKFPAVDKIDVRIEKPDSPIDEKLGSVGVEYSASRDGDAKVYKRVSALLSLGSNMGDRRATIEKALEMLGSDPRIDITKVSSFYETEPMYIESQKDFYNIAAQATVGGGMDAFGLFGLLKSIEYRMGRRSGPDRYGPRPIDIDILYFGNDNIKSDILQVPHPRIGERRFVLIPLAEIAPYIEIGGADIDTYIKKCGLTDRVNRVG